MWSCPPSTTRAEQGKHVPLFSLESTGSASSLVSQEPGKSHIDL